ncbi:putative membrane associated protein [Cryptosporidium felis]|nr:putative membrane associated protein [Cryptosporidium felis]
MLSCFPFNLLTKCALALCPIVWIISRKVSESAIIKSKEKFVLPNPWDVSEKFGYIKDSKETRNYFLDALTVENFDFEDPSSHLNGLFSKEEKKFYVENQFIGLENVRDDLLRNWAFNIKYGSSKIARETSYNMIMHFIKRTNTTNPINRSIVVGEDMVSSGISEDDPIFGNFRSNVSLVDPFIAELRKPIESIPKCWEIYSKLVGKFKYELYNREFDALEDPNNFQKNKEGNLETLEASDVNKIPLGFNRENFDKLEIGEFARLLDPILISENSPGSYSQKTFSMKSKMLAKHQERKKFLLRYTCELYMKAKKEVFKYVKSEYGTYNFHKLQVNSKIYQYWKTLYLRSPSHGLWYLFKQLIPVRGDMNVFGLANGDLPFLPTKEKMSIPDEPPDFFEYTTMPKSCSNNLVALSLNNGYRIQLGISKTPRYVQFGKLYRYFENSLTISQTSLNLCIRAIKLQTLFQAYYYTSINEYRPDPTSYFYWQTPDWDSLAGYISYLPTKSAVMYPARNQFIWCLLWVSSEYTRTFSKFRINPIKLKVVDVLHIPMKMQNIGIRPNLESCFILLKFLWFAKLLRINKRPYRPLGKNSSKEVILDYSSIYYICIAILKCRTTFHRAYLKHFKSEEISTSVEKAYDTQDPQGDYNTLNKRFLVLSIPKLRSLKKVKTVLYGVVSTVLFGALTGITILNVLTSNQISNDNIFRSSFHNPLQELGTQ